ncbi:uncharacterized protein G2W53_003617 [Senna tora]|uniref:Uncharacterized protein n=1 Tax=Senna tora TaxID=362788 RepID=A0A835CGK1_9FABA|nr:uncharacterized protein G2W53_003617 [Senna tora]
MVVFIGKTTKGKYPHGATPSHEKSHPNKKSPSQN